MNWRQRWLDCLFLHFPAPAVDVERLLPLRLEIETFGGSAWISYVLFRLNVRPPWLPYVPGFSSLAELNIRTYVRHRGQSGICFLRVLADNRLAIAAARLLSPLPYEYARIRVGQAAGLPGAGSRLVSVESLPQRCDKQAACRYGSRRLELEFAQPNNFAALQPGTQGAWLLERYRLFIGRPSGAVIAADAEHPPWQATALTPIVSENTLCADLGLELPTQPAIAHYSPGVSAQFNAFHTVAEPCRLKVSSDALSFGGPRLARP